MPSGIVHRCVLKRVLQKYPNILSGKDFRLIEIGNLFPDCWRNSICYQKSNLPKTKKREKSHFHTYLADGDYFENYEKFYQKYGSDIIHPFYLGYEIHLLTDYYFRKHNRLDLTQPIILRNGKMIKGKPEDKKRFLYEDMVALSSTLKKYFQLEELALLSEEELRTLPEVEELDYSGLNQSLSYENQEDKMLTQKEPEFYQLDSFLKLIDECSDFIVKELILLHEKYF